MIGPVLDGLRARVDGVIVVDDGSGDRTSEIALGRGVTVIRHSVNRGLGAALGTGMAAAIAAGADAIVTFDADGQHAAEDVPAVVAPVVAGQADVVIGTRLAGRGSMPVVRRIANYTGNLVTYTLFGARVSDSQSGFRALSRRAAEQIEIRTDRMEVSSEIIAEAVRRGLRIVEVPIQSRYTSYSLSKGQSFGMGIRTLGRLIVHRMQR